MSMHIIKGVQVHGNSLKKKKKLTQAQLDALEVEWRKYNKDMRKNNMHSCQFEKFDDYVAYTRGTYKPSKKDFTPYVLPSVSPYIRQTERYPSLTTFSGIPGNGTAKQQPQQYTGNYIIGIATMHKSNLVPVTNKEQATEAAQMRRN